MELSKIHECAVDAEKNFDKIDFDKNGYLNFLEI